MLECVPGVLVRQPSAIRRYVAGATGILLGILGCYGAYQTVQSYRYARFIDVRSQVHFGG